MDALLLKERLQNMQIDTEYLDYETIALDFITVAVCMHKEYL